MQVTSWSPQSPEMGLEHHGHQSINTLGKATSSGSYLPAKTCPASTALHNQDALGNKGSSHFLGGKCPRPRRCCRAGSGQGITPASQRIMSPTDGPWMGSCPGEKPPLSISKTQEPLQPSPSSLSGSFLMKTPVKNKGNYIQKECVKIALRV